MPDIKVAVFLTIVGGVLGTFFGIIMEGYIWWQTALIGAVTGFMIVAGGCIYGLFD